MNSTILKYGLIAGASILVYTFLLKILFGNFDTLTADKLQLIEILSLIRYLIIIVCVIQSIRFYTNQVQPNSFLDIAKQGLYVSIFLGSLIGIYEFVYILKHPTFYEKYVELFIDKLQQSGANQGSLEAAKAKLSSQEWLKTPWQTGVYYFVKSSLVGISTTLFMAMFIDSKRKREAMKNENM